MDDNATLNEMTINADLLLAENARLAAENANFIIENNRLRRCIEVYENFMGEQL